GSCIGKPSTSSTAKWTDVVLTKERSEAKAVKAQQNSEDPNRSGPDAHDNKTGAPKLKRTMSQQDSTQSDTPPTSSPRTGHRDRHQVKSMVF
ncbi:hypothetical protein KCU95_g19997, partial [Aureobasidium melanogenum]